MLFSFLTRISLRRPTPFLSSISNLHPPPRLQTRPYPRHASQSPWPRRPRQQYSRFSRAQQAASLWRTHPPFRGAVYTAGGGFVVFIGYNIETVPVSGRRRFNWVSPEREVADADAVYTQTLREFRGQLMPADSPEVQTVKRVIERLIPNSDLDGSSGSEVGQPARTGQPRRQQQWAVHVIDAPEANAFVIPGGKVFVFRGILPVCQNDDGLAAVLGHEIAHNVAHHTAENYSRLSLLVPFAWLASLVFDVSGQITFLLLDLAYNRPGSRKQESEADYIGLLMMARSCYDPQEALALWQRMEAVEKQAGGGGMQFLSTHPSNTRRIEQIQGWLAEAEEKRNQSECGHTLQFADGFRKALGVRNDTFQQASGGGNEDLW